jgi:drug/metabolite transporter (DMT)-like permease
VPSRFVLPVALISVWIFWGSTYAGMHLAVASIPPFAMSALRFTIAGGLLWAFAAFRGAGRPTRTDFLRALVLGATLLVFGNGITAWTLTSYPTGLASLILSLAPVWMAVFDYAIYRVRISLVAAFGMVLGIVGLVLLVNPRVSGPLPLVPTFALVVASMSWGFGSIYQRRSGVVDNVLVATAMQMLFGGAILGVEAGLLGQWAHLDRVTPSALFGLGWLIVFGSLIAYSAYLWLFQHASTALAATYAYVNPLIAVALGVALFHERVSALSLVATFVIVCGVALMMLPTRVRRAPFAADDPALA